ncbi:hypothetical protein PVAND_003083 [Polypedilum vanderplanki]|uniref:Uncharacterized protein n=1 Tax=Polypedilum vanderplanki TaxID=319348 RepID=A0A9J6BU22_POLVA|nr:hypothetical protein PVAND_003083 [Polypedilum vanderplanki]
MNFKLVIQFLLLLSFYHGGFTNELYLSCGDHGFDDIACMFSVNTTYQITHTTVYFWHEGITNDDISIIVPHYSFDDEIFAPNIPSFLCDTFKNLKYIRFYQGVKAINVNTFKNCHNIEYIHIGRNELRELPKNAFVNQQNLKTLYINNNSISILHSNSFGLLSNLRTIDFSSNNIDAIDERIFDNTGTREIHANNNPCVDSRAYCYGKLY